MSAKPSQLQSLRYSAEAKFCLSFDGSECEGGASQSSLQHRLSSLRECFGRAQVAAGRPALTPWRMVSVTPSPRGLHDADQPTVRILDAGAPLVGASIIFGKAPHAGCSARTDANGVASCRLVDEDDDDDGPDSADTAVVATFPGVVRSDVILPPTTEVLRR